jgi:DNA mismatch repair ATPase MutS
LKFCYPEVSDTSKEICNLEGFDLALANKLVSEDRPIVCNDFFMQGKERIFVVSGPNQGGKTTFARTFGQLHYLASLGCPVPGKEAKLFLFDKLFTHFEKEETVEDLKSRLEDDLTRIHGILNEATSRSIVIANEILTSTTLNDAVFLGKKVMESLSQLDLLCVWVTFVEELVSYSDKTVSMVSVVAPENPSLRTYKIIRRHPHGLSYAKAMAEKYGLTYESLKERIK